VVVDDLDIVRVAAAPAEAHTILVVDANTVRALPIAAERIEPIARRHPQVVQGGGCIQHHQLPQRQALNLGVQPLDALSAGQRLGRPVGKAGDHAVGPS
jgi:hypothetical protein